jgi:hypothetical protein
MAVIFNGVFTAMGGVSMFGEPASPELPPQAVRTNNAATGNNNFIKIILVMM